MRTRLLQADVLLENLVTKATGVLAVRVLLKRSGTSPEAIDYIMSCSEEAIGDRYQRGGGNLAKAVGEACGLVNATGSDVKAFCAGPVYAIVHAASLVKAGVFERVIVFGGGCQCKLGMKFAGHLKHDMPILEDVLGGMAFLITQNDGVSPVVRLESVGKHRIGDGSSPQEIFTSLIVRPLERLGLRMSDVDKIATELHNPEVTLPQGSGNVPLNNYKMIAALAVMRKEIGRGEMEEFIARRGMPGFSPTQGHIPAAVPYLGPCRRGDGRRQDRQYPLCGQGQPLPRKDVPVVGRLKFLPGKKRFDQGKIKREGGGSRCLKANCLSLLESATACRGRS